MTTVRPKIVTIGGGTGHFTVLSGLKTHPVDLTAVVSMADSGGSTGVLRDELGVLPPGDVRQCLVALSDASETMRALFTHRFDTGTLKGHTLGNIVLSGLEQITGSMEHAIEHVGSILKIHGRVLPVSLDPMHLFMKLKNGRVLEGEHAIDAYQHITRFGVAEVGLRSRASLNPRVRAALKAADLIVIGPGDLYTSLVPPLLVSGMARALATSPAKKCFMCPLMNKYGQTDGFTVREYLQACKTAVGTQVVTDALCNETMPPKALLRKYLDEGEPCVSTVRETLGIRVQYRDLLANTGAKRSRGDVLARSYIRHDPQKLARAILENL